MRWFWLVAMLLGIVGCADEGTALREWRLLSATGQPLVTLPGALAAPVDERTLVLERELVPEPRMRGRSLDLVLFGVQAPASLEVDGQPAVTLQDGFDLVRGGFRTVHPQRFRLPRPDGGGPRRLTLRIRNTWYQAKWIQGVPRIMLADEPSARASLTVYANSYASWICLGAAVECAAMFLAVFLFGGRRRAYLWFGLQGFSSAVIPLYYLGYTQVLFGRWEGGFYGALIAFANTISVRFTHEFFQLGPPPRGWWFFLVAGTVVPLVLGGPFTLTPLGAPFVTLLITLNVTYQLHLCFHLWRARGPDFRVALFAGCWSILGLGAGADSLSWFGLVSPLEGVRLGSIGLGCFAFLQSILLASHYRESLNAGDVLNSALQEKVSDLEHRRAEVETLNTELRAQVNERSQQMFLALSLAASRAAAPVLEAGQVVHARYDVLDRIGHGGMGNVYRVRRRRDGRILALKVTHDVDGVSLARLAREATMIARIAHHHVVELVDVDVAPEGFAYLIMEMVEGATLSDIAVSERSPLWCLRVFEQALDGLSALHELEIVHRDIKPHNLIVGDRDGQPYVKLVDFGISRAPTEPASIASADPPHIDARANEALANAVEVSETVRLDPLSTPRTSSSSSSLTRAGVLAGTPTYMAPELAGGGGVIGKPADMFAFGIMVHHLLTGAFPFEVPPLISALQGQEPGTPTPLDLPWVRGPLRDALVRTLAIDPSQRPSASELRFVIKEALAELT